MKEIKISVILPVYNVEKYLPNCLDSIVEQTLDEFEIICIEDGSEDNSLQILKDYSKKYNNITIIEYGCNKGQAYARNRGIEVAKGKYIYFMDSDDRLKRKDGLEIIYNYAEEWKLDCLIFDASVVYESPKLYELYFTDKFCNRYDYEGVYEGISYFSECYYNGDFRCAVWQQLWSREFIVGYELYFDEDTSPHEDLLFTFKAFLQTRRLKYIRESIYEYRCRESSSTTTGFSLKRFKSYCLCYFYSIMYLQDRMFSEQYEDSIVEYLNDIKKIVKSRAIELIKNGVNVYSIFPNTDKQYVYLKLMLTEDYPELPRLLSSENYRACTSNIPIVYGVGTVGENVLRMLKSFGIEDFFLAVTKRKKNASYLNGRKIYEIAELTQYKDCCVIIASKSYNRNEMESNAKTLGFQNIVLF